MFERGRLFNRMAHAFAFYYKSAVEAFEEALEVYLAIGYPVETALTLHHLGSARANVEDIGDEERQEVLTLYRQALSIATKARFPGIYANIQSSVCAVLLDCAATVPNLSAAVRAAEEALSAQGPQENPAEFARACINHAEAYLAYASLEEASEDKALHYLEGALSSAEAALGVVGPGVSIQTSMGVPTNSRTRLGRSSRSEGRAPETGAGKSPGCRRQAAKNPSP